MLKFIGIGLVVLAVWTIVGAVLSLLFMPTVKRRFDKHYPLVDKER